MAEERLKLENEVKEILAHIENGHHFLLSGGAGSGKTYSLVSLINTLFTQETKPKIACITYTNAAAQELAERLRYEDLKISTIHDFLWDIISPYQKELKEIVLEKIKETDNDFSLENIKTPIQYKEYCRLKDGIISHDEVIDFSYEMFKEYPKLCEIVASSFDYIFVDEYQDTNSKVIEILLDFLPRTKNKIIIGLFGDSMQAIYDKGIGDVQEYIDNDKVKEVVKKQNRRNPKSIIDLANKIRVDGLKQEPSKDITAPNMENGAVKQGNIKFLYSKNKIQDFNVIRNSVYCSNWNFADSNETKELRLTHRLIAEESNFKTLFEIYDKDPFLKLIQDLKKHYKENSLDIPPEKIFSEVIKEAGLKVGRGTNKSDKLASLLETPNNVELYNYLKERKWEDVKAIYFKKENLIDGKKENRNDALSTLTERDVLIKHLLKIQSLIELYQKNEYTEFIRKTDYRITRIEDKKILYDRMKELSKNTLLIGKIVELSDKYNICKNSDSFNQFVKKQNYLYHRVSKVPFEEIRSLYTYVEGYLPYSTQHKVKGLEYNNVLVLLNNGGWNNYNFNYLFGKSKSENESVVLRTKKIFYVCCTRVKENLVVVYEQPSVEGLQIAQEMFGEENVICIDD